MKLSFIFIFDVLVVFFLGGLQHTRYFLLIAVVKYGEDPQTRSCYEFCRGFV